MPANLPVLRRNIIVNRIINIALMRGRATVYLDNSNNARLSPSTRARYKSAAASLLVDADEMEKLNGR